MTDTEMAEAVQLARAFDDANSNTMKMGHALTIARALIESRRQVEALTKERESVNSERDAFRGRWQSAEHARRVADDQRDAATARAERELAVIKAACPTSTVLTEHCRCGSGAHPRECKRHPFAYETHVASMDAEAREVAVAVTTERARLVEAIAAWHDEAARIDGEHGNSFQAYAHALSAAYLRSHNWTPPEEESK